jgi:homoserine dehydrogenase
MNTLRIGMAGCGTVGGGVWRHLAPHAELLRQRTGKDIAITKVAVRTPAKAQAVGVPADRITTDWRSLASDPDIDVVVELMGGTKEARELIAASLKAGKHVVTANKALLAECGAELFEAARRAQRQLLFEASVAGGIPIIKSLREGLIANRILSVHGIINGTCNYILTRMTGQGLEYAEALAEAKAGGYAEADESLDVDGHDAAHKAAILASLAYGFWVEPDQLYVEGIRNVERRDIDFARKLGYELKLLAIIKMDERQAVEVRVHPTLIPRTHVLASVSGVFNAISVHGDVVGETLFYGRGAGADATASAVLGDIAEIAAHPEYRKCKAPETACLNAKVKTMDEVVSRYYLRLDIVDRPGVLAKVAAVLGAHAIGISSVIQPEVHANTSVPLILMLHDAQEKQFQAARREIEALDVVKGPAVVLRVEDFA